MTCTTIRSALLGLLLTVVSAGTLFADSYTGTALSLEWLVDSSDAIQVVRLVDPAPRDTFFMIEKGREMKVPTESASVQQCLRKIDQWHIPINSTEFKKGDNWLVFLRTWEDKQPTMLKHISLSRPLERSATAAIDSDGMPLVTETQILQAVEERVRLNRKLTGRARKAREQVDKGELGAYPWGEPSRLNLGGFKVHIGCNLWDYPAPWYEKLSLGDIGYRIIAEDLDLTDMIVPADPKYHKPLLEAAGTNDMLFGGHASTYLVNYPGEETERVLEKVASNFVGWSDAKYVLWYFKYRHDLSDPLNVDLRGPWRLVGEKESIDLVFNDDNTFTANGSTRSGKKEGEEERNQWHGRGYWVVRNNQLSIFRHQKLHPKLGWQDIVSRTIFADKNVIEVSKTEVVLDGGPLMQRLPPQE